MKKCLKELDLKGLIIGIFIRPDCMSPCTAMNIDLDTSYRITREGLDRLENQDLK